VRLRIAGGMPKLLECMGVHGCASAHLDLIICGSPLAHPERFDAQRRCCHRSCAGDRRHRSGAAAFLSSVACKRCC